MNINYNKILLPFVLIDVLFLPILRPLPITLSLIPVLIWNFKCMPLKFRKKDITLSFILILFAVISFFYSVITLPDVVLFDEEYINPIINNTFMLGLFLIFFMYLFFFRYRIHQHVEIVYKILEIYLCFNFVFAVLYWYDHYLFFKIRSFWTFSGKSLSVGEFSSITRFTGTLSDPNNAAVAIVMIYAVLFSRKIDVKRFLLYSLMVAFIVMSTMSSTGTICLAITFTVLSVYLIRINKASLSSCALLLMFVPLAYLLFTVISELSVVNVYLERISGNTGMDRLEKVLRYITSDELWYTLLIGSGGTVFLNGEGVRPHIGHFHIIFNYGFYAWILFMYVIFRIRTKIPLICFLPVFIFFLGFTVNVGIIDFRFTVIASLVVGIYMANAIEMINTNKEMRLSEKTGVPH